MNADEAKWLLGALKKVQFFSTFSMENIDSILKHFQKYTIPADKVVIEEGRPGEAFFVIYRGKAKVLKKKFFFFAERIAELGEGGFFGEMSLVFDKPTSATVITEEECEVFSLLKRDFQNLLKENPELKTEIQYVAERRQFDTDTKLNG